MEEVRCKMDDEKEVLDKEFLSRKAEIVLSYCLRSFSVIGLFSKISQYFMRLA